MGDIGVPRQASDFSSEVLTTTGVRVLIWKHFTSVFPQNVLFGQGFGGWQDTFSPYAEGVGLSIGFPPHNMFIYLWSQSGIFAPITALIFIVLVFRFSNVLLKSQIREISLLGAALGAVATWTFAYGLGENSGLLGDPRQQTLFSALIGLAYARARTIGT